MTTQEKIAWDLIDESNFGGLQKKMWHTRLTIEEEDMLTALEKRRSTVDVKAALAVQR